MVAIGAIFAPPTCPFWGAVGRAAVTGVRALMGQAPAAAGAAGMVAAGSLTGSTPMQRAEEGAAAADQAGTDTCTTEECRKKKKHWHHEMPQQYRPEFERRGINIDLPENGRVIPASEHLRIHGQGYNPDWGGFFAANRNATASDILAFRDVMVQKYGLGAYPKPSGPYPIQ